MPLSITEENYLKCIYSLSKTHAGPIHTNAIADRIQNSAAAVTDMIKKLASKKLVEHIPYRGVRLLSDGEKTAIFILRKHRLWEYFLYNNLGFTWDELHPLAEQLEHIQSESLVDKLDAYLGFPKFDPHGDPIPNRHGKTAELSTLSLHEAPINKQLVVMSVVDRTALLQYLTEINIGIGSVIEIIKIISFDDSLIILSRDKKETMISHKMAELIFVQLQ